jgi:hypothetical protein
VSYLYPGGGDTASASVFVMTEDMVTALCRGPVKGGVRFCTDGASSCTFKSHAEKKVEVLPGAMYIFAGRNRAHTKPYLPLSKVTEIQAKKLLSERHLVSEWSQLFHILRGYNEVLEDKDVNAVVQQVTEVSTPMGKTPKRRKMALGARSGVAGVDRITPVVFTPSGPCPRRMTRSPGC